jgi:hypothetical protein
MVMARSSWTLVSIKRSQVQKLRLRLMLFRGSVPLLGMKIGSFKSARNADMKAPMDFAIVMDWQVCAKHLSFLVLC